MSMTVATDPGLHQSANITSPESAAGTLMYAVRGPDRHGRDHLYGLAEEPADAETMRRATAAATGVNIQVVPVRRLEWFTAPPSFNQAA